MKDTLGSEDGTELGFEDGEQVALVTDTVKLQTEILFEIS